MFEMMIKQLMKNVDFEKLQSDLLNDPRVREALDLAGSIRDDFAMIKATQSEIMQRLDMLTSLLENSTAKPTKSARAKLVTQSQKRKTENGR